MPTRGKNINGLQVGQKAVIVKTITAADIRQYSAVTGDTNPLHTDRAFAKTTPFGEPIAQGMLSASVISACIGSRLPGPGTIYLSQELRFLRPVKIGDTVIARIEVTEIIAEKNRVRLKTTLHNQRGEKVIEGSALVMPPTGDHGKKSRS
ncbi:MAG: MaoC family dehydratase [Candidatus Methylomirabilales bacterium]